VLGPDEDKLCTLYMYPSHAEKALHALLHVPVARRKSRRGDQRRILCSVNPQSTPRRDQLPIRLSRTRSAGHVRNCHQSHWEDDHVSDDSTDVCCWCRGGCWRSARHLSRTVHRVRPTPSIYSIFLSWRHGG
jgi:hypothetical protein